MGDHKGRPSVICTVGSAYMTPQDLVSSLLLKSEEQGRRLLQTQVPLFTDVTLDQLVYLLKKETDRRWTNDAK